MSSLPFYVSHITHACICFRTAASPQVEGTFERGGRDWHYSKRRPWVWMLYRMQQEQQRNSALLQSRIQAGHSTGGGAPVPPGAFLLRAWRRVPPIAALSPLLPGPRRAPGSVRLCQTGVPEEVPDVGHVVVKGDQGQGCMEHGGGKGKCGGTQNCQQPSFPTSTDFNPAGCKPTPQSARPLQGGACR